MAEERFIREVKESDYSKPPYEMENKAGRPKTWIKEDQRLFDTDQYCLEVKERLLKSLQTGELPFAGDTLFMHNSVFDVRDQSSWDTTFSAKEEGSRWGKDDEYYIPVLDDNDYLKQFDDRLPPEEKVRRYLRDSD